MLRRVKIMLHVVREKNYWKNTFSQGFSKMINFLLHHAKYVSKEIHTFAAVNKQF